MLVTTKSILTKARKHKYAIGAFNVNNLEILQGVMKGTKKMKSPVILATSEGAIKYAGLEYLYGLMKEASKAKISVAIHLDHGKNLETIKKCIKIGYTSVMIDASKEPYTQNLKITKKIVGLAHRKGVSVEAELGTIGGTEDLTKSRHIRYTQPNQAKDFVTKTGCDSLAVAIGTSHGAYKFKGKGRLHLSLLKLIADKVKIPLVLHGASGIPQSEIKKAEKFGADLKGVVGVPDTEIKKAIKLGITKINTDTDLRLAFNAAIRKHLMIKKKDIDPRHMLGKARDEIAKVVEHRIKVFGSGRSR